MWQCRAERAQGITEMVLIRSIRALSCATSCGARSHRAYWVGEAEDLRGEAWGSRIGMHIHGSEAQVSMEAAAGAGRGGQSHAGKQNDARAVLRLDWPSVCGLPPFGPTATFRAPRE